MSLNNLFSGWGATVLISAGLTLAAPALLTVAGAVIRPMAKGLIKGGLSIADAVQGVMAESSEQLNDLVAEVQAERAAANVTEGY